jgi:hypothetical protein
MNGKAYSMEALSLMIEAAQHYVEVPNMRDSIIAKCHWEVGLLVCAAPIQDRANIKLTRQEVTALNHAFRQLRASSQQGAGKGGKMEVDPSGLRRTL